MMRYTIFVLTGVLALALFAIALALPGYDLMASLAGVVMTGLFILGVTDLIQTRHAVLRNYPVIGHMRWLFEGIRPEIRQYLIESDEDEEPFSREVRSLVYQRAKNVEDKKPFGTHERVYDAGYSWMTHSVATKHVTDFDFRVSIGGPDCKQPYNASIYNISAMSFGALSGNAILALNKGAKAGGFAHDTGEGGISRYHREGGGDLIFQVGTGYFGCRRPDGGFDEERFAEQAADPQVKMIELKLSQGAKPGHGGMLPAAKITPEIAEARHVPMNEDCISPPSHSAFSTPLEMVEFIGRLRELSGGKPVGFKLCIGHRREFMCIVKAMLKTDIYADFIVVDGSEGGTGAAPLEFSNHMGMPLQDGLMIVHNTLRGAGIRGRIRIGAAGKMVTAFDIARTLAMGADWCNSARGFMFSVGCIQAQACHTNECPVGVATQDKLRQKALNVADKSVRVANFHNNTLKALGHMIGAAGLEQPYELSPYHFNYRQQRGETIEGDLLFVPINDGSLLDGSCKDESLMSRWRRARPESFARMD
ncbi:MAG: FMN-binding glutamate synthase family protein [Rhodobacteraceae bacterium]|nr:FMN-binding glutamate synthase family protein [Paracoccaceae bacterium]